LVVVGENYNQSVNRSFFKYPFSNCAQFSGRYHTERVIRTIKEDLIWIREFDSVAAFEIALKRWQKAYNEDYPHSSLGYMTPYEYEPWFKASAA